MYKVFSDNPVNKTLTNEARKILKDSDDYPWTQIRIEPAYQNISNKKIFTFPFEKSENPMQYQQQWRSFNDLSSDFQNQGEYLPKWTYMEGKPGKKREVNISLFCYAQRNGTN